MGGDCTVERLAKQWETIYGGRGCTVHIYIYIYILGELVHWERRGLGLVVENVQLYQ